MGGAGAGAAVRRGRGDGVGAAAVGHRGIVSVVLRDKLVNLEISRTDFFSLKYIRLILTAIAMLITPLPLRRNYAG